MPLNPDFKGFCLPPRRVGSSQAKEIISSGKPVVVKLYSPGCPSCTEAAPELQQASCPYRSDAEFLEIDIDQDEALAEELKVESIPFVAAFRNGELVDKKVGADKSEAYERFIKKLLGESGGSK